MKISKFYVELFPRYETSRTTYWITHVHMYIHVHTKTCDSRLKELLILKEHLLGMIKEKEYRDIKMHAFQRKSIKNDCHKFISIINVKLAS